MTITIDELITKMFKKTRPLAFSLGVLSLLSCNTGVQIEVSSHPRIISEKISSMITQEESVVNPIVIESIPEEEYTCKEKVYSTKKELTTFCLYANTGGYGSVFSENGRIAVLGDVRYTYDDSISWGNFSGYILDSLAKEAKKIVVPMVSGRVTGISEDGNIFLISDYNNATARTTPVIIDIAKKTKEEISLLKEVHGTRFLLSPNGNTITWSSQYLSPIPYEIFTYNKENKEIKRLTENKSEERLFSFSKDGTSLLFFSDKDLTTEQKEKYRNTIGDGHELYTLDLNNMHETRISECQKNSSHAYFPSWKDEITISYFCMNYEEKKHTKYEFNLQTGQRREAGVSEKVETNYYIHQTSATVWIEDWINTDIKTWSACTPSKSNLCSSYKEITKETRSVVGAKEYGEVSIEEEKSQRTEQAEYSGTKPMYDTNNNGTTNLEEKNEKPKHTQKAARKKKQLSAMANNQAAIPETSSIDNIIKIENVIGGIENEVYVEINGKRYYEKIDARPVEDWLPTYITRERK